MVPEDEAQPVAAGAGEEAHDKHSLSRLNVLLAEVPRLRFKPTSMLKSSLLESPGLTYNWLMRGLPAVQMCVTSLLFPALFLRFSFTFFLVCRRAATISGNALGSVYLIDHVSPRARLPGSSLHSPLSTRA